GRAVSEVRLQEEKSERQQAKETARRRSLFASIIFVSVAIHVVGLLVFAAWWVIARYREEPPAQFTVSRTVSIPAQTPEHRMNMAKHEAMAPKPTFNERLISTRPADFALPELPEVDMDQMLPLDPSELVADHVSALVGTAGLGSGAGFGESGSGGLGGKNSFFGIETDGTRILLLFDVSQSVLNKANATGMPLAKIKEETLKLIEGLPPSSRFGIIQFVRNYKPFSGELVPASDQNKALAKEWVENEWQESWQMPAGGRGVIQKVPNGIQSVLDAAFAAEPDTIFLISDGSFWRDPGNQKVPYDELQKHVRALRRNTAAEDVPIHFIGFQMRDSERDDLKDCFRGRGAKFKEIK
ncbi:MAG: hypothetical protein KDB35_18665, partial [Acidimicrobiales bacterium]|nr:hypothetical protein [Acidimicrobiales bacterium]